MDLLDTDEVRLLEETRRLLDDLLETLDVLGDPEAMAKLRQAREDVQDGRTLDFESIDDL